MESNKSYAGIGSRETPYEICLIMKEIASDLESLGFTLRSGGATGADQAFESGVSDPSHKIIFIPWRGFNNYFIDRSTICKTEVSEEEVDLARRFHPNFEKLSSGAKKLMIRNTYQILGADCNSPASFVICWHDGTGGTTQACRIAKHYNIPIINIYDSDWRSKFSKLIDNLTTISSGRVE